MKLIVVTPEGQKVTCEVDEVTLPGGKGEVGILPGHLPLMSTLEVGILSYTTGSITHKLAVNRGFFEVLGDEVRVTTETCETPEDVDRGRAEAALKRAKERLDATARDTDVDVDRAMGALQRATARLDLSVTRR